MESMDEILSEKEPEKQEVKPEAQAEPEKPASRRKEHLAKEFAAQGRDPETGQYLTKEEPKEAKAEPEKKEEPKVEAKPKEEFTERERAFLKGMEEERKKRQEFERRLAELEKPKTETKPEEKKNFWDDPEGHFKSFEQRMAQQALATRLQTSEQIARSKYNDFDAVIEVFGELLQSPAGKGIHAQFVSSPDPGEFAYRLGKHTKELREVGSIDAMREKIAKEERIKLEAEFKKKQEEAEKQRAELTPSLSDVKGAAKPQAVWKGPTPMTDILGSR